MAAIHQARAMATDRQRLHRHDNAMCIAPTIERYRTLVMCRRPTADQSVWEIEIGSQDF
jgi:hypothetical protein